MSGNLGGGTLGGVAVGDWLYTLGSGLYNGCVDGCWLRTLGAVAYRLMRLVNSIAILGGDCFGLGGGLGTVLGLSCANMSASLDSVTLVSVPKTSNGASGDGLRKR